MKKNYLSTKPYKGARDIYPDDLNLREYIFNIWKQSCRKFGFIEYDTSLLENFEVFASKTGEDIVNNQLYYFTDKGDRKVAIRPELTPSTVRMIADKYNEIPKPIKWYMIGQNWRFEKPQRGRGREFYQLEANIFGIPEVESDLEIMALIIDIMRSIGATEKMYKIHISDRRLINALLKDYLLFDDIKSIQVRNLMDKRKKLDKSEFIDLLSKLDISVENAEKIDLFMNSKLDTLNKVIPDKFLLNNEGYKNIIKLFNLLKQEDLLKFCEFDPSIIRGFDYSDGLVYEVFDQNPTLKRSLFGGERFDKLINIFGNYELSATGFAMGDIPIIEFMKNWELIPEMSTSTKILVTLFNKDLFNETRSLTNSIRNMGINCEMYLTTEKLDKQLKYADKRGIKYVIIMGENEINKNVFILKNLSTQMQKEIQLKDLRKNLN